MDTDQTPTPRKRSRRGPRCTRDGCGRTQSKGNTHCTHVCLLLDHEFVRLEQVCRRAGPRGKSVEAWTSLVEIADAWSEYVKIRGIVNHIATRPPLDLPRPTTLGTTTGDVRPRHQQRDVRP
jgi:hypothetical protein